MFGKNPSRSVTLPPPTLPVVVPAADAVVGAAAVEDGVLVVPGAPAAAVFDAPDAAVVDPVLFAAALVGAAVPDDEWSEPQAASAAGTVAMLSRNVRRDNISGTASRVG